LFVVGGAAMALAYDRDRLTRDVDALFVPAPEVRRIAEEMSGPHGLEPDWLNDAAKGFLPGADEHPRTVFESESLLVQVASPEYLLAMKRCCSTDSGTRPRRNASTSSPRPTPQASSCRVTATSPKTSRPAHRPVVTPRTPTPRNAAEHKASMAVSSRSRTPGSTARGQTLPGRNVACSENASIN
jgi:hypothetical protein